MKHFALASGYSKSEYEEAMKGKTFRNPLSQSGSTDEYAVRFGPLEAAGRFFYFGIYRYKHYN
ncbi:MAG: hypothetical protein ACOWWO_07250 [Peptococcaceae bacterium]